MTLESAKEFAEWQPPELKSIIPGGILPLGINAMIWGDQDTFKSWLMLDLAFSVAEGRPWLVFPTEQHKVILINAELPKAGFHER